ncbi:SKP1-like protein 1A [Phoenix dactylifera]|uniref:SKP1-like protein n=1 Tax=Phoenix dactylifera TaxID=42345 RepID=A0A8B7BKQ3_PHODC|nr:SKP1-like protein 1A [Phoenix dactylifera]
MATAAGDAKKTITLRSSDGEEFEVEEAAAKQSKTLTNIIEDGCADGGIPVSNVTGKVLAKVLEYCKKHADSAATEEEIAAWDYEYINVEQDVLYEVIVASNYLNIKSLLELGCRGAADMIKGRTPAEIRQWFKIPNDFSAEELREVKREMLWAFE